MILVHSVRTDSGALIEPRKILSGLKRTFLGGEGRLTLANNWLKLWGEQQKVLIRIAKKPVSVIQPS